MALSDRSNALLDAEVGAAGAVPPVRVVRRIRTAYLSLCRCGDKLFSPYGITTDQSTLIWAVHCEPGIRQADLGSVMFAEPNTVTAMVRLLEKRGILRRKPSPTDRRAKLVYLTPRGEMLMQRLDRDWRPIYNNLLAIFSKPGGPEALVILDEVHELMRSERERLTKS
jgi:DNA-binding MarR family transcriptional regulator